MNYLMQYFLFLFQCENFLANSTLSLITVHVRPVTNTHVSNTPKKKGMLN